jgi:hypothetical protein
LDRRFGHPDGDWGTAPNWTDGNGNVLTAAPNYNNDVVVDASGGYELTITAAETANSLTITSAGAGADVQDETGGSLALNGALTIEAGSFSLIGGTLVAGSIYVGSQGYFIAEGAVQAPLDNDGGNVDTYGNLSLWGAVTGSGTFNIETGNTLEFGSSIATGAAVAFAGTTGTLQLDNSAAFAATISGFTGNDVIDLTDLAYASSGETVSWTQGTGIHAAGGSDPSGTLAITDNGITENFTLSGSYSSNNFVLASDSGAASAPGQPGTEVLFTSPGEYSYVTDFTKTNNIQSALISQFPTGVFTADNSLQTPFDIASDGSGNNFYDGFTHDSALTINVAIPDATNVYTLINAYAPYSGDQIATVEFIGSAGATETFTLVAGTQIRDFFQGTYADSINGTTTENAFTVYDTVGGAGSGDSSTGSYGTYNIDEQNFTLNPAFASQTLTEIVITDLGGQQGGTDVPILLGATAQSAEPVDHWVAGSDDWTTTADWSLGAAPTSAQDAVIDASGTYTVDISESDTIAATSLVINAAGATVTDEGSLTLSGALTVNAGTFDLDGGTASAASVSSSAGTTLDMTGGTLTITGVGSDIAGALNISAGMLDIAAAVSVADLTLDNQTFNNSGITGAGTLTVTDSLTWDAASTVYAAIDLAHNATGTVTNTVYLDSTLTVDGQLNVNGNGGSDITLGSGYPGGSTEDAGLVQINSDGGVTIGGGDSIGFSFGSSGGSIDNSGQLVGDAPGSTATVGVAITNESTGVIEAEAGNFTINGAVTGTGSATIDGGAVLDFAAAASVSQINFDNGSGPTTYGEVIFGNESGLNGLNATVNGFTGTGAGSVATSDVIELAGNWSTNSSPTGTGGNLTVALTDSSNESVTLTFENFANGSKLTIEQQDGNTFIVDPPGTGSPSASSSTNSGSVLIGGPGNDTFVFHPGMGAETISNFAPQDTIELDQFANVQNLQQLASDITSNAHGDALIELGHGDSLTVAGMTAAQLQAHLQSFVHLH